MNLLINHPITGFQRMNDKMDSSGYVVHDGFFLVNEVISLHNVNIADVKSALINWLKLNNYKILLDDPLNIRATYSIYNLSSPKIIVFLLEDKKDLIILNIKIGPINNAFKRDKMYYWSTLINVINYLDKKLVNSIDEKELLKIYTDEFNKEKMKENHAINLLFYLIAFILGIYMLLINFPIYLLLLYIVTIFAIKSLLKR